ncbi:MAG: hypothetical protein JWQ27_319 [Ferruginibacter sp.]|nr:hypothetical protein [Ferruginibacter sp.]
MKSILIVLTFAALSLQAGAQTATDSVKAVVNNLFTAMKNADGKLLASCFADSAILQTITKDKSGQVVIKNEPVQEFIEFVKNESIGAADERIVFETVKTDGALAIAWTPYQFYYKGQFSHCGVNSFQLVRTSTGWKIQYLIDTRRKAGCN